MSGGGKLGRTRRRQEQRLNRIKAAMASGELQPSASAGRRGADKDQAVGRSDKTTFGRAGVEEEEEEEGRKEEVEVFGPGPRRNERRGLPPTPGRVGAAMPNAGKRERLLRGIRGEEGARHHARTR